MNKVKKLKWKHSFLKVILCFSLISTMTGFWQPALAENQPQFEVFEIESFIHSIAEDFSNFYPGEKIQRRDLGHKILKIVEIDNEESPFHNHPVALSKVWVKKTIPGSATRSLGHYVFSLRNPSLYKALGRTPEVYDPDRGLLKNVTDINDRGDLLGYINRWPANSLSGYKDPVYWSFENYQRAQPILRLRGMFLEDRLLKPKFILRDRSIVIEECERKNSECNFRSFVWNPAVPNKYLPLGYLRLTTLGHTKFVSARISDATMDGIAVGRFRPTSTATLFQGALWKLSIETIRKATDSLAPTQIFETNSKRRGNEPFKVVSPNRFYSNELTLKSGIGNPERRLTEIFVDFLSNDLNKKIIFPFQRGKYSEWYFDSAGNSFVKTHDRFVPHQFWYLDAGRNQEAFKIFYLLPPELQNEILETTNVQISLVALGDGASLEFYSKTNPVDTYRAFILVRRETEALETRIP